MMNQPPLLDQGISLPGPNFTPRLGWGGRLRRWLSENFYQLVFRLAVFCALILIGHALFAHREPRTAEPTESTKSPASSLTLNAQPGDGMSNLAAHAIDLYVSVQTKIIRLDSAQHLYAVDSLSRTMCWCPLELNQSVQFPTAAIAGIIDRALNLSHAQHAAWERLLKR